MDVGKKAAKLKSDWEGHIRRMHDDRWAKAYNTCPKFKALKRATQKEMIWKHTAIAGLTERGKRVPSSFLGGLSPTVGQYRPIKKIKEFRNEIFSLQFRYEVIICFITSLICRYSPITSVPSQKADRHVPTWWLLYDNLILALDKRLLFDCPLECGVFQSDSLL